jgi:hypothetical protein
MKHRLKLFFALFVTIVFAAAAIQAGDEKKMIIEVKIDRFKSATTDVN